VPARANHGQRKENGPEIFRLFFFALNSPFPSLRPGFRGPACGPAAHLADEKRKTRRSIRSEGAPASLLGGRKEKNRQKCPPGRRPGSTFWRTKREETAKVSAQKALRRHCLADEKRKNRKSIRSEGAPASLSGGRKEKKLRKCPPGRRPGSTFWRTKREKSANVSAGQEKGRYEGEQVAESSCGSRMNGAGARWTVRKQDVDARKQAVVGFASPNHKMLRKCYKLLQNN